MVRGRFFLGLSHGNSNRIRNIYGEKNINKVEIRIRLFLD